MESRISEILRHPLYIKKYIKNNTIRKIKKIDLRKPQHKLCVEIAEQISELYLKNRSINRVADILNVKSGALRDFLLSANKLKVINYRKLKAESKHGKLSCKIKEDKEKKKLIRKIVKNLRQKYSIQKVAKSLNMSFGAIRDLLFRSYNCKNINDLRKKLKIKRNLSNKEIAKLRMVKELYDKCLTLERVAEQLHLTRERIRQLLNKGEKYGLFEYELNREKKFRELLTIYNRDSLIKEIKLLISPSKICLKLNIKQSEFDKLLQHFNIDYKDYRLAAAMGRCLEKYSQIVDALGYHPTTTEMNTKTEWRAVWGAIDRYWGNMEVFRKEFGIQKPIQKVSPRSIEGFRMAAEKRKAVKIKKKEQIIELFKQKGILCIQEICETLGFKRSTVQNCYIPELITEGMIKASGFKGRKYEYTLAVT
jgi:AraC-like DNA-binding protein